MDAAIAARLAAVDERMRSFVADTHVAIETRIEGGRIAFDVTGYGDNFMALRKVYGWFTIDEAEALIDRRLSSAMGEQRAQGVRFGGAPARWESPDDVDLAPFIIEKPALLSLTSERGEDETRIILKRSIFHGRTSDKPYKPTYIPSDCGLTLELRRGVVRGTFRLSESIEWRQGTVMLRDSPLPDTILGGMRGTNLHTLVTHPMLTRDIEILHARNERHTIRGEIVDVSMIPTRGGLVPVEEELREIYGRASA